MKVINGGAAGNTAELTGQELKALRQILAEWKAKNSCQKYAETYFAMNGFRFEITSSGTCVSTYRVWKDNFHAYYAINHGTEEDMVPQMQTFKRMWPHIKQEGA